MQPITVALGLTVTVLALTALLVGPQFEYLAPHTRVLVTEYWPSLTEPYRERRRANDVS